MTGVQTCALPIYKKELVHVEKFLKQIFKKENLPEKAFNKVLLCVSEAVMNCIEHGNKNEWEKKVTIEASYKNNNLRIEISDEGEGFDLNDIADPTTEGNIKNDSGRGIYIMKSICSTLNFRDKGKCVEIKIELM